MQGTRWSCGHPVGAVWGQTSWKPLPTSWEDCLLSNSYTEYINYECVHRKCGNKYQGAKSQKYNIVKSEVHLHTHRVGFCPLSITVKGLKFYPACMLQVGLPWSHGYRQVSQYSCVRNKGLYYSRHSKRFEHHVHLVLLAPKSHEGDIEAGSGGCYT